MLIRDDETALTILHQLRDIGVRIALDDFGTGYSSLSYLKRFPFDKIKIDSCFIGDIAEIDGSSAIVQAVVNIAASRNMTTTAEGVETAGAEATASRARLHRDAGLSVQRREARPRGEALVRPATGDGDSRGLAAMSRQLPRSRLAHEIAGGRVAGRSRLGSGKPASAPVRRPSSLSPSLQ